MRQAFFTVCWTEGGAAVVWFFFEARQVTLTTQGITLRPWILRNRPATSVSFAQIAQATLVPTARRAYVTFAPKSFGSIPDAATQLTFPRSKIAAIRKSLAEAGIPVKDDRWHFLGRSLAVYAAVVLTWLPMLAFFAAHRGGLPLSSG